MARKLTLLVGMAAIDGAIKEISKVADNLNDRIHTAAASIIAHAAGAGNGDVSRAITLCQTLKRYRSININYLIGYFERFGSINVNMSKGTAKLFAKDSKSYRGYDVDGAKANPFFTAVDEQTGEKAEWYRGPVQDTYEPDTIGDVSGKWLNFVKRERERLDATKTVAGKEVPVVRVSDSDKLALQNALALFERFAATLARHESVQKLEAELKAATDEAGQDKEVIAMLDIEEEAAA